MICSGIKRAQIWHKIETVFESRLCDLELHISSFFISSYNRGYLYKPVEVFMMIGDYKWKQCCDDNNDNYQTLTSFIKQIFSKLDVWGYGKRRQRGPILTSQTLYCKLTFLFDLIIICSTQMQEIDIVHCYFKNSFKAQFNFILVDSNITA